MLAQLALLAAPFLFPAFLSLALWKAEPSAGRDPAATRVVEAAGAVEAGRVRDGCSAAADERPARPTAFDGLRAA